MKDSSQAQRSAGLRALALAGVVALPLAWFASLAGRPDFLTTNLYRVVGAVIAAGSAWAWSRSPHAVPWKRCVAAGVFGSFGVSVLSIFVPALGLFTASGWLLSGLVGGLVVGLAVFGFMGPSDESSL